MDTDKNKQLQWVRNITQLPSRPTDGHKGLFGRVLVVGGSEDMIGAPVLAGTAALRMGAGLVQVAMLRTILPAALSITPELIGLGLPLTGGIHELVAAAEMADALVIGPGMGKSAAAMARLKRLMQLDKPAVVDADALNLLAMGKTWPKQFKLRAVLTPHPGEMKRLGKLIGWKEVPTDEDGRIKIATEASRAFGQIVLLKGHRTVVTDGNKVYINHTGDSTLAKAGTGDVLSGIIGCLLAQNMSPFDAAALGAHLHGRAGELAGIKLGRGSALASDVIGTLPEAIAEFEGRHDAK